MTELNENQYDVSANMVKRVYDYLKQNGRIDKVDDCYQEKIRQELGISRSATYKALNFLEDLELIERKRSGKKKLIIMS